MRYEKFEQIVLVLGGAAILGSLALSFAGGGPATSEVVAQLLLFATLAFAVHFGRRGGLVASTAATAIYLAFWIAALPAGQVPTASLVILLSRVIALALVGIIGGELCGQLKYTLAKVNGVSAVDDWSRVYNQTYALDALTKANGRFTRYGEPFSVVEVTLSPSLFAGLRSSRQRSLIRTTADHIRGDVRMVDEVARLDDGRFIVMLPHTPQQGGTVVSDRIAVGVRRTLGSTEDAVQARCIGLPGDEPSFDALLASIRPTDVTQAAESGA